MAEWSNAHAWKACVGATSPGVRIPLFPPLTNKMSDWAFFLLATEKNN